MSNEPRPITNVDFEILPSAQRVASLNSADFVNASAKGVLLFVNVTAVVAGTLDLKLQAKDSVSGLYIDIPGAAFVQITGTGQSMLTVYPGIAETANISVSDVIPRIWRVALTMASTPDMTFSVGGCYVV